VGNLPAPMQASRLHWGGQVYQQSLRKGEGTISQGTRSFALRHARYRGIAKTKLQHLLVAIAMNLTRFMAWVVEHAQGPDGGKRVLAFARAFANSAGAA